MIKIDKTITIDGDDVQTLSKICEAARIYLQNNARQHGYSGIFHPLEVDKIYNFLDVIWDK